MVVEGVEHDLDRIVGEDVFAATETGPNFFGFAVEANENRVEVLVVVSEVDNRALG